MKELVSIRLVTLGGTYFYICKLEKEQEIKYYASPSIIKVGYFKEYNRIKDNEVGEFLWSRGKVIV